MSIHSRNTLLYALVLVPVFLLFIGCVEQHSGNDKPLARVHDKYLYQSDINDIFPASASESDSTQILMAYVDRWVRKQLLLEKAEKNLSVKQKNVTQQLEDYRTSLLIFKYEQEFIRQKLDTVITTEEIEEFYEENRSNFMLNENIVKALFVKIPIDDQYYDKIKSLYKSNNEDDIKTIDNLAYQVAVKYDYFNDDWVSFSKIQRELPEKIENIDLFLSRNRSIEMNDGTYAYLVNLRDVLTRGEQSPLSYEKENIRDILINKRKKMLISDLETKMYNDARNHNQIKLYLD
ncbi:MAG: hypothetical protein ACLFNU_05130 [Bacteroidales bacterium]